VIQTNFTEPVTEAGLLWLLEGLREGMESGCEAVILKANDYLFLPLEEPGLAVFFVAILNLLVNRPVPFVLFLNGEING
jgi:hypothetical protein